MKKDLNKEYLDMMIAEKEMALIHLGYQNKYWASKDGQKAKGTEIASELIKENEKQIAIIEKELAFFKKEHASRIR